jgi:hypothetical protein
VCSVCGEKLEIIGSRKRKVIDSDGAVRTLVIRRLRCEECGVVHHELPDMVAPYKRHCMQTIEKIIGDEAAAVCCEESTIRKIKEWWTACRLYFESVTASLAEKHRMVFSKYSAPREIIRAVANTHLWVHTRSAFLSG